MNKTILTLALCSASVFASAQTTLPYSTSFDNATQQSGWTQYHKGVVNPTYQWEYDGSKPRTGTQCLIHYYPVGGNDTMHDWFVSPEFSFPNGGVIDSIWHAFGGFGDPIPGDTVALYYLTGNQDPELADTKTRLILYTDTSYKNDGVWRVNTNIALPAASKGYIAIRYTTEVNWLDVRFDDIYISENGSSSTSNIPNNNGRISIYPNPASDVITIKSSRNESIHTITLQDLTGREVRVSNSNNSMVLEGVQPGVYMVLVETSTQNYNQRIVVE